MICLNRVYVKREEGFICYPRIKLDYGKYRKKFKPVDYDKCTEELGDSSPVRKRFQQTTYVIFYTWYTKPLLVSIVRDHDSKFIWGQWASPVSRAGPLYLL